MNVHWRVFEKVHVVLVDKFALELVDYGGAAGNAVNAYLHGPVNVQESISC